MVSWPWWLILSEWLSQNYLAGIKVRRGPHEYCVNGLSPKKSKLAKGRGPQNFDAGGFQGQATMGPEAKIQGKSAFLPFGCGWTEQDLQLWKVATAGLWGSKSSVEGLGSQGLCLLNSILYPGPKIHMEIHKDTLISLVSRAQEAPPLWDLKLALDWLII